MAGLSRTSCVKTRISYTNIRLENLKKAQVFAIDLKKHILNASVNNSIWESNDRRDEREDSGLLGKLTEDLALELGLLSLYRGQ
jgi:hypothetical protein